ncbi:MAG: hypothetical protein PVTTEEND_002132 [Candidatus Fervidibacter sp.]|jgi:hypothetical protein
MRVFLCPRCGEWMDEAHPDFPRCIFCGEHLLRCGFCRHFPGDGRRCPRAKGHPVVYAHSTLDCPYHAPVRPVRSAGWRLPSHARWQLVASAMFTLSVVLIALLSRPTPAPLLLTASAPRQVVIGETWEMRLLVQSDGQNPVRLRLDRRLLSAFQLVGLNPLPLRVQPYRDFYEFFLPPSPEPQPIVVRLKSVRTGKYALRAILLTPQRQAEWRTRIAVVKANLPRPMPKKLGVLAMALWR